MYLENHIAAKEEYACAELLRTLSGTLIATHHSDLHPCSRWCPLLIGHAWTFTFLRGTWTPLTIVFPQMIRSAVDPGVVLGMPPYFSTSPKELCCHWMRLDLNTLDCWSRDAVDDSKDMDWYVPC